MSNINPQTNYSLGEGADKEYKGTARGAFKKMLPMLSEERSGVIISFVATLLTSVLNLVGPLLIGYGIDTYVVKGNYGGVLRISIYLLAVYAAAFATTYAQMRVMGGVAQRVLWRLRNDLFLKLQELPLSFFNQNKSGDLISRINNDTDKINEFFSQNLMRFAGNIFMVIGTGVFILSINAELALVSLIPAFALLIFMYATSKWVKRKNKKSLTVSGSLSAEIQESIANFKIILAFNRRDYFRTKFEKINKKNYEASLGAGIANELYTPVFEFMGNVALLMTLAYGLYMMATGQFAIGLLVSFIIYITRFYDPLREMARLWASLQTALAAWDRIGIILGFRSDMQVLEDGAKDGKGLVEFRDVSFTYMGGKSVLKDVNLTFERGKTYALVGPTGGGKTTTASLIARLFDPTEGTIYLEGSDIRTYDASLRTQKIGFILQEPYLFSGTIKENLLYGTDRYADLSEDNFKREMAQLGFDALLSRFESGLETKIDSVATLSLGEKQIIAFMRAVLREPDILILDEATANIDTVTEKVLDEILTKLPEKTTRVIIAHRLNTIENADDIFFVNGGHVTEAGSMEHAVDMLLHGKRES